MGDSGLYETVGNFGQKRLDYGGSSERFRNCVFGANFLRKSVRDDWHREYSMF